MFATLSSMLMDLVEDIQLKTGRREEGVLFSARSFADKAVSGFGLTFAGIILSLISFPETTDTKRALHMVIAFGPESLIIAIAPLPEAVANATTVSFKIILIIYCKNKLIINYA